MDEWVFRQEVWTTLLEQLAEKCIVTLGQIFTPDNREFEIRDASILLAQLISSDAASRYWSLNTGQHQSRNKEAQKKIRGTAQGFLKGGDQTEYLQDFCRRLGRHACLGGVSLDDYREIIFIATGKDASETTVFVSELVVQIEQLSDIAYSLFKNTEQTGNSQSGSVTSRFRLQFSDGVKRPGISTRKAHKHKATETTVQ